MQFEGRWHKADAELLPSGPRPNGPPILIAGKRRRMLQLVARHADAWNAAWYGRREDAGELVERISRLRAACDAEGRDPATISLTVGLFVHFPALADPGYEDAPSNAISGTAEEVGEALGAYRDLDVEHLIVHLWPPTPAAVTELGRAAEVARAGARIAAHG